MPAAAQNSAMGPNSYIGPMPSQGPRDDRGVARQYGNKPKRKYDPKQQPRDYNSSYGQNGPMRKGIVLQITLTYYPTLLRRLQLFAHCYLPILLLDTNYVNTNRRNMSNGTSKPTTNGGVEEDGSTGSTGTGSINIKYSIYDLLSFLIYILMSTNTYMYV